MWLAIWLSPQCFHYPTRLQYLFLRFPFSQNMSNNHQLRVYDSMKGLLSGEDNPTPLVLLNKVTPFQHTKVYAKLEWYNPFGAVKDRVAANLIQDAEQRGDLQPGVKLVEATSGNTGVGLAMMGNLLGYSLRTPLSAQIPLEKRTTLRFFGAEVEELDDSLCPAPGAPEGAIARARDTGAQAGWKILDQYINEANPDAHYKTTGPEIWKQTEGKISHFVAGLGTCGTITGTGRFLKEQNPAIQVLGSVPEEGHSIPGVRSYRQLQQTKLYRPDEYDGTIEITDREAYGLCMRLNREEAIIAGPSSGMNLQAAFRLIPDEPGNVAVVIFCDNIFKYASSVIRQFPELAPPNLSDAKEASGSSKNDLFVAELMENLKNRYDTIKVKDLSEMLQSDDQPLVVDIRIPQDYEASHIPGSINVPLEDLKSRASEFPDDRDAPIITVCNIGKFSKQATIWFKSRGYRNVRSAKGGLNEWVRKGLTTES